MRNVFADFLKRYIYRLIVKTRDFNSIPLFPLPHPASEWPAVLPPLVRTSSLILYTSFFTNIRKDEMHGSGYLIRNRRCQSSIWVMTEYIEYTSLR